MQSKMDSIGFSFLLGDIQETVKAHEALVEIAHGNYQLTVYQCRNGNGNFH